MNVTTDTRSTRIAVFIDFDNVEIGVKNTIGGQFDIGLVLEAIKERGEIVTKIAYSDWKRAGDYSRLLTQHAIRMVQRNVTPGGDKNGADITMALDALEMAFTHDHINAFVIVGGDSDFISLVEKLKQYGRKVIVVGGRQFTSATMQQNCHEFIAYENLVGSTRPRSSGRGAKPAAATSRSPRSCRLIERALKVLSDREVTPQLGLLKSTLLQLDSTFSEREYGAGSFRDFMEKVAAGRRGDAARTPAAACWSRRRTTSARPRRPSRTRRPEPPPSRRRRARRRRDDDEETLPASPMTMQDGIRAVQTAFGGLDASAVADVRAAGEAVSPQRHRRLRRAEVRLRVGRRSAARRRQGGRAADRARSPGCGPGIRRSEAARAAAAVSEPIEAEPVDASFADRRRRTRCGIAGRSRRWSKLMPVEEAAGQAGAPPESGDAERRMPTVRSRSGAARQAREGPRATSEDGVAADRSE